MKKLVLLLALVGASTVPQAAADKDAAIKRKLQEAQLVPADRMNMPGVEA